MFDRILSKGKWLDHSKNRCTYLTKNKKSIPKIYSAIHSFKITTTWDDTFVLSLPPLCPYFAKIGPIDRIEVRIRCCNNSFTGVKFRSRKGKFQGWKEPKITRSEVRTVRGSPWIRSCPLWETLSSYWKYVVAYYRSRGWISSSIPVFFFQWCVWTKFSEPHSPKIF